MEDLNKSEKKMRNEKALKWELNELQTIIGRYDNFTYIIKGWCFTFYVGLVAVVHAKLNTSFDLVINALLSSIILVFYSLEVHYRIVHGNCIDRSHDIQEVLIEKKYLLPLEPRSIRGTIREEKKHGVKVFFKKFFKSLINARVTNIYAILTIATLLLISTTGGIIGLSGGIITFGIIGLIYLGILFGIYLDMKEI